MLEEDYFSLFLFALLNPIIDSMRGVCAASHLKRVQNDICSRQVSLGSFSEAQGVFDPELLKHVFLELAGGIIVGDRFYGLEYGFLEELRQLGVSFVFRIRNKPRMEIIEELELTEADRAAGIT